MIAKLQEEIGEWSARNFPNNKPHTPLLGVIEEVGELSHAHLKLEQGIRGNLEQHKMAKEDAVGDVFIYLADYCGRNGIDMQVAILTAWNEVKSRDWIKFPKNGRTE